jgi:hypothetical protein
LLAIGLIPFLIAVVIGSAALWMAMMTPRVKRPKSIQRRRMANPTDELLRQRARTHGSFPVHAQCTQNLKEVLRSQENWGSLNAQQREALEMICHKMGRIMAGDATHADHWNDIAGYARLNSNGGMSAA